MPLPDMEILLPLTSGLAVGRMDTLSERLSKEDYALVEELREQVAIAQCEENESHFKYGFSAGLLVQQEAHTQVSQKDKE